MESTTLAASTASHLAAPQVPPALSSIIRSSDLTRRKNGGIGPRRTDYLAWLPQPDSDPVLLFRSPVDPSVWLTRSQKDELIASLISRGIPFMSPRRGFALVEKGVEGQIAFLKRRRGVRRERVQFRNGHWVPYVFQPSMSD